MRGIAFLLEQILKTALRIEHKLDILVRDRKAPEGGFLMTPQMKNQTVDPVSGQPVKYSPVNLEEHGRTVMFREETDAPDSVELPRTIGE